MDVLHACSRPCARMACPTFQLSPNLCQAKTPALGLGLILPCITLTRAAQL
jgi:hypothetical protein